jgi:hypothetical protein
MNARGGLVLALLLIASIPAAPAQSPGAVLSHVGSSSFWIDVPPGWTADADAASKSDAVFVFVPTGATGKNVSMRITCRYYKDTVQTVAMHRTKRGTLSMDPTARFVELPSIDARDSRTIVEELHSNRYPSSANAYITLGSDVLVIGLGAASEESYQQGLEVFLAMLKSYREVIAKN